MAYMYSKIHRYNICLRVRIHYFLHLTAINYVFSISYCKQFSSILQKIYNVVLKLVFLFSKKFPRVKRQCHECLFHPRARPHLKSVLTHNVKVLKTLVCQS
jgi:hypothetical protein